MIEPIKEICDKEECTLTKEQLDVLTEIYANDILELMKAEKRNNNS